MRPSSSAVAHRTRPVHQSPMDGTPRSLARVRIDRSCGAKGPPTPGPRPAQAPPRDLTIWFPPLPVGQSPDARWGALHIQQTSDPQAHPAPSHPNPGCLGVVHSRSGRSCPVSANPHTPSLALAAANRLQPSHRSPGRSAWIRPHTVVLPDDSPIVEGAAVLPRRSRLPLSMLRAVKRSGLGCGDFLRLCGATRLLVEVVGNLAQLCSCRLGGYTTMYYNQQQSRI